MFATSTKSSRLHSGMNRSSVWPTGSGTASRKLTKERWQAAGILILFAALLGFLMYLAVMSGMTYPGGNTGYEFWMMP